MRGYVAVGIYQPKFADNFGTLLRTAYQLGAAYAFVVDPGRLNTRGDTTKAGRHMPVFMYENFSQFLLCSPPDATLIGVEMGGTSLQEFAHPLKAIYLMGAEDSGLPELVQGYCKNVVTLDSVRSAASYNVAVAASIVMYHRVFQRP